MLAQHNLGMLAQLNLVFLYFAVLNIGTPGSIFHAPAQNRCSEDTGMARESPSIDTGIRRS
jgi:hypothetical protein